MWATLTHKYLVCWRMERKRMSPVCAPVEDEGKSPGAGPGSAQWYSGQSSDWVHPAFHTHPADHERKDDKKVLSEVSRRKEQLRLLAVQMRLYWPGWWSLFLLLVFVSDLRKWMMAKCSRTGHRCWSKFARLTFLFPVQCMQTQQCAEQCELYNFNWEYVSWFLG